METATFTFNGNYKSFDISKRLDFSQDNWEVAVIKLSINHPRPFDGLEKITFKHDVYITNLYIDLNAYQDLERLKNDINYEIATIKRLNGVYNFKSLNSNKRYKINTRFQWTKLIPEFARNTDIRKFYNFFDLNKNKDKLIISNLRSESISLSPKLSKFFDIPESLRGGRHQSQRPVIFPTLGDERIFLTCNIIKGTIIDNSYIYNLFPLNLNKFKLGKIKDYKPLSRQYIPIQKGHHTKITFNLTGNNIIDTITITLHFLKKNDNILTQ